MNNIFSAMDAVKPLKTAKSAPPRRNKRKSSPVHTIHTVSEYELRGHPMNESKSWRDGPDKSDASSDGEPMLTSSPTRAPTAKRAKVGGEMDPKVINNVSKLRVEETGNDDLNFDAADFDDLDFQDLMEVEEAKAVTKDSTITEKLTNTHSSAAAAAKKQDDSPAPAWLDMYSKLATKPQEDETDIVAASTNSSLIPNTSADIEVLEEDGTLHFFWLDYLEEGGRLFLIGKVLNKSSVLDPKCKGTKKYISCLLKVEGTERNLFILPRDKRVG